MWQKSWSFTIGHARGLAAVFQHGCFCCTSCLHDSDGFLFVLIALFWLTKLNLCHIALRYFPVAIFWNYKMSSLFSISEDEMDLDDEVRLNCAPYTFVITTNINFNLYMEPKERVRFHPNIRSFNKLELKSLRIFQVLNQSMGLVLVSACTCTCTVCCPISRTPLFPDTSTLRFCISL